MTRVTTEDPPAAIRLTDIHKRFGQTVALDGVSFELRRGEIHALLGENGAGKSTLMNVLYGMLRPDSGAIELNGEPVALKSPSDAIRAGIGMVHQHFMLVPNLTVAENALLGARRQNPIWFRRRESEEEVARVAERFGVDVNPRAVVGSLPVGVQQRVEILKCLARDAETLILDEPTAVLTPQEVDELAVVLGRLRDDGRSVVFISHKLKEILAISDRVTVLRRGKDVGSMPIEEADEATLSEMMVGRAIDDAPFERKRGEGRIALEVENVSVDAALKDVSFAVKAGEILGVAGVDGNGQVELLDALAGIRPVDSGRIALSGEDIARAPARERTRRGLAVITDDRQRKGLILDFSVAQNIVLKSVGESPFSCRSWLNLDAIREAAAERRVAFDIRAESVNAPVSALSGGNQQKVVVAREMTLAKSALVAVNPTRGLDVGAAEYVHRTLMRARDDGAAILLISNELDEIITLSDRIAVLYRGSLTDAPADRHAIGRLMLGRGADS